MEQTPLPGPLSWLDQTPPKRKRIRGIADFPDHHFAAFKCMVCDNTWTALYPLETNPHRMQCRVCDARDSEMVTYFKRIWKH
jgi:hypothetical protein